MPSRFIRSVSLKMLNVDHLIVNGDVYVFDTRNCNCFFTTHCYSPFLKFRQRQRIFPNFRQRREAFINTDKRRFKIQTSDMGPTPGRASQIHPVSFESSPLLTNVLTFKNIYFGKQTVKFKGLCKSLKSRSPFRF